MPWTIACTLRSLRPLTITTKSATPLPLGSCSRRTSSPPLSRARRTVCKASSRLENDVMGLPGRGAHGRPDKAGASRVRFAWGFLHGGFAPTALRACPHGLCRGSVSPEAGETVGAWASPILFAHRLSAPVFTWGLCPHGPAGLPPRALSWHGFAGSRRNCGRMGFAHFIRSPPLGVRGCHEAIRLLGAEWTARQRHRGPLGSSGTSEGAQHDA